MKSLTGKYSSARGWALLLILFLGAGLFVAACGEEEVPAPTTPPPAPEPEPEAPAVPTGLRISATGMDFIEWSWTPVEDVSGYDVQYSANEAFTDEDEIIARTAEEISYRRDGLDPETSGYLRVRSATGADDDRVTSDWSTHMTGMTMAAPPPPDSPPLPAGLDRPTRIWAVGVGENFIEWEWNAVDFATGYEVSTFPLYEDPGPGHRGDPAFAETTSVRVEGLPPDTGMTALVRAVAENARGRVEGPWSDPSALQAHRRAHAVYTLRADLLMCSDERQRARNFSRELLDEWDGSPFRVDIVDTFPIAAMPGIAERLLEPLEELADRIERQLGYRVLDAGTVLPPPTGGAPSKGRCLPREPGQIQGFYVDYPLEPGHGTDGSADLSCRAFRYHPAAVSNGGLLRPEELTDYDSFIDGVTMHELFHLLGFRHPEDEAQPERDYIGVSMSYPLRWAYLPWDESVQWQDLDVLRCIFPQGGR